jgi:predicted ATPase/DNA-binding SARP family transcriptional activator
MADILAASHRATMFRAGYISGSEAVSVDKLPSLRVRLLGPSEIAVGDRVLGRDAWKGRKARTLLLVLLNASGHQVHREQLLDILWPDLDLDAGNNALYKTLHSLRRTLEPTIERRGRSRYIETRGETVGIASAAPIWTDVDQFQALVAQAGSSAPDTSRRLLRRALVLHRGLYLADEPYADWPGARREALRTEREQAVLALAARDRDAGDPLATVPYLEALLTTDLSVEPIHRALMVAYAAGGQRDLALRQFERCREILDRELGDQPEPETTRLARTIRDQVAEDEVDLTIVTSNRGFLPALPSRTVGREKEIERLCALLLQPETRLVTVVGPGGVGKTRLATDAAHRIRDDFPDGVHFVSLAPVTDPDLLFDAIASALRLHDDPTHTKQERVVTHLRSRTDLLVLDNLEQLEAAATGIAELIEACPSLTVLATSRIPLRLRAEQLLRLSPLALPDPTGDLHVRHGAAELFWQILEGLDATGGMNHEDERSIVELCTHLDGLPLAIELAAARCGDHAPATVLTQMREHNRLSVLRGGPRDLPDRQQSLYQVVLWSYDLLAPAEQALFRQTALFPGGMETDALHLLGGSDAEMFANRLAEASLAQWEVVDGVRRLTMLQTVREVAHLLLEHAGELECLRRQQGDFYQKFAARAAKGLEGVNQIEVMARFRRELDTLRSVLDWAASAEAPTALALEIMTDTAWLWDSQGLVREGFNRLRRALENAPPIPNADTMMGTAVLGKFAVRLGRYDDARAWAQRARELAAQIKNPIGILQAGVLSCLLLRYDSEWDACVTLNQDLLPLARRTGDPISILDHLMSLGIALTFKGEQESARVHLDEALAMARETANHIYAARMLLNQIGIALDMGDFEGMRTLLEQTEQAAALVNDMDALAWTAYYYCPLHFESGDRAAATAAIRRASNLFAEIGSQRMVVATRATYADLLSATDPIAALEVYGQTIDLMEALGTVGDYLGCLQLVGYLAMEVGHPADGLALMVTTRERILETGEAFTAQDEKRYWERHEATRALLNTTSADAAEAAGRAMSIEDATQLARRVCMAATSAEAVAS